MTLDDFTSSEPGQLGSERWLFRAAARASYSHRYRPRDATLGTARDRQGREAVAKTGDRETLIDPDGQN